MANGPRSSETGEAAWRRGVAGPIPASNEPGVAIVVFASEQEHLGGNMEGAGFEHSVPLKPILRVGAQLKA